MADIVKKPSAKPFVITIPLIAASVVCLIGFLGAHAASTVVKPKKPRFEYSALTIKDTRTGLVWSVDGNMAKRRFPWSGAFSYIATLNHDRYSGFRDWRLPTREELMTLVEYARGRGYDGPRGAGTVAAGIESIGFRNVIPSEYWTATENHYFSAEAWIVDMTAGSMSAEDKNLYYLVWPVRGD